MPLPNTVAYGLEGKTSWQIVDTFIDECAKRGLWVMLDMHDIMGDKAELWYEVRFTSHVPTTHGARQSRSVAVGSGYLFGLCVCE